MHGGTRVIGVHDARVILANANAGARDGRRRVRPHAEADEARRSASGATKARAATLERQVTNSPAGLPPNHHRQYCRDQACDCTCPEGNSETVDDNRPPQEQAQHLQQCDQSEYQGSNESEWLHVVPPALCGLAHARAGPAAARSKTRVATAAPSECSERGNPCGAKRCGGVRWSTWLGGNLLRGGRVNH